MIQGFSNAIGRAVEWTADSSWGLNYWQSLAFKLLDSRFAPPLVSTLSIAGVYAYANSEQFKKDHPNGNPSIPKICFPFQVMLICAWLWETKLLSRPLDGATMRTILAHTAVAGTDALSAFGLVESDNRVAKGVSAAWLAYRLLDVALTSGSAAHNLVRLDFDPTLGLARQLAFWAPN